MPRYVVVDKLTYIDCTMHPPGAVVEYAGWPGSTLEPADGDAVAAKVKAFYAAARKGGKKIDRLPNLDAFAEPIAEAKPTAKPAKPSTKDE